MLQVGSEARAEPRGDRLSLQIPSELVVVDGAAEGVDVRVDIELEAGGEEHEEYEGGGGPPVRVDSTMVASGSFTSRGVTSESWGRMLLSSSQADEYTAEEEAAEQGHFSAVMLPGGDSEVALALHHGTTDAVELSSERTDVTGEIDQGGGRLLLSGRRELGYKRQRRKQGPRPLHKRAHGCRATHRPPPS